MKETTGALRYNENKTRYGLLPPFALKQVADVFTYGAKKYSTQESGDFNWKKGLNWLSVCDSLERHLQAWKSGEDYDKESGLMHLGHLATNALFLLEYYKIFPQGDNRPTWLKQPFKRLWLDIDGVISSFEDYFLTYSELQTGGATDWNDYRFRDNFAKIADDDNFWLTIPPLIDPKVISYPITGYCTSRPCDDAIIEQWLEKNGFPKAEIINVGLDPKSEHLKGKCDIMLDDSIKNFLDLQNAGIVCYLMTRPHNEKYEVGHWRVETIEEFFKLIK